MNSIRVSQKQEDKNLCPVWKTTGAAEKNTVLSSFLSREILALTGMILRKTPGPARGKCEMTVPDGIHRFSAQEMASTEENNRSDSGMIEILMGNLRQILHPAKERN